MKPPLTTVDDYIAAAESSARPALRKIRSIIRAAAPAAQEIISYRMPAYRHERRGRVFIYFAAFKAHIGMYPPVRGNPGLTKALKSYRGEKGNLKFPLNQPLPYALIKRVVLALGRQYGD